MSKFERINNASIIPKFLVEQVKENDFDPERFYSYMKLQEASPTTFLYVLIDNDHIIHGYLWFDYNILDNEIFVNTLSVSQDYGDKIKPLNLAVDHVQRIARELKVNKVLWQTDCHRTFESLGFKQSRQKILEWEV